MIKRNGDVFIRQNFWKIQQKLLQSSGDIVVPQTARKTMRNVGESLIITIAGDVAGVVVMAALATGNVHFERRDPLQRNLLTPRLQ